MVSGGGFKKTDKKVEGKKDEGGTPDISRDIVIVGDNIRIESVENDGEKASESTA